MSVDTAGFDTWLARLLHARGRLDLPTLQRVLADVRRQRHTGLTLAQTLLRQGLVPQLELEAFLGEACTAGPQDWTLEARVEHYELEGQLGAGGMGVVFLARDTRTDARYAIKTLAAGAEPELMVRFQREGEAQARVDAHPNVVKVHAMGTAHGRAYLVQDLASGGDLAKRLVGGPLPPRDAAALIRDLARGLEWVHRAGVLHRDLKPENVLFDERGTPKLVDFGLAHVVDAQTLTQTGTIMGSPRYMAPEQASGDPSDARTDVYGLCAVLYHCLAGHAPFTGHGVLLVLAKVLNDAPPPLPDVPPALAELCLRGLSKAPSDRPESAAELAELLDTYLRGELSPRRPAGLLAGALAVVALAGLTAGVLIGSDEPPERELAFASVAARAERLQGDLSERGAEAGRLLLELERDGGTDPRKAALRERLLALSGLGALASGDPQRARAQLVQLSNPRSPPALALRGGLAADSLIPDERRRAIEDLTQALRLGLDEPQLYSWRAQARVGDDGASSRDGKLALEDLDSIPESAWSSQDDGTRVQAYLAQGRIEKAELALAQVESPPPELGWWICLARLEEHLGQLDSHRALRHAAKGFPPPPVPRRCRRRAQRLAGLVRRELERIPGDLLPRSDQRKQATDLVRLLHRLHPEAPFNAPLERRLLAALTEYKVDKNLTTLRFAVAFGDAVPGNLEAQRAIAELVEHYHSAGSLRILIPATRRALALERDPSRRAHLLRLQAKALTEIACSQTALPKELHLALTRVSERLVGDAERRADWLLCRGRIQHHQGSWQAARVDLDEAVEILEAAGRRREAAYARGARALVLEALKANPEQRVSDAVAMCLGYPHGNATSDQCMRLLYEHVGAHPADLERVTEAVAANLRRRHSSRPGWWARLAWLQLRLGQRKAAVESLEDCGAHLVDNPQLGPGRLELAERATRLAKELRAERGDDELNQFVEQLDRERARLKGMDP